MIRSLLATALFTLSGLAAVATAAAAAPIPAPPSVPARAYLLEDYQTGRVLGSDHADDRMEPASLTKLMTAYIVFTALHDGRLKLTDQVTISEHAWRSEGSRTFVQVGTQIPVDILIKGMIVQSGNDATVALAERVAGTEDAFVQVMNEYARRLGMAHTHYANADGLPNPDHYTTARDLALLAHHLIADFPDFYPLFSLHEFSWNNIKQQNRNGLLERRSHGRWPEDRPHRQRRVLPGHLLAAQRHAPDLGGAGLALRSRIANRPARRCWAMATRSTRR